ncbi:ABC transporter permease [Streptomyces inusitatus]|uniref:ABC transporter permease n=1 Tax=Streptomyces inusitatus TaxID=68221 RepID=A0A918Q133_9ACTN|nr:ABC transporter permease [Streptomyces inusitatus]GGZ29447.1 ABC transporter permease [Streptomyces inusitatus]
MSRPLPPAARWLLHRAAGAVLVLWGAASLAFLVLHLVPGDPVTTLLGASATDSTALRAEIRREYRLDDPAAAQYAAFLARLATGELGDSYQQRQPVSVIIGEQLGHTAELALGALVLLVAGALLTATLTAGRGRRVRGLASGAELIAVSTPAFWLGIVLLTVFSFRLNVFPVAGAGDWRSLALPVVTLAVPFGSLLAQVLREGMESALHQPFALTARSRGLRPAALRLRHALRHAAVPAVTLSGWLAGGLLSGTVLVETVFARPGLGRVALDAVSGRDIPVVVGLVLLSAAVYLVVNALADLICLWADPRLRSPV